MVPLILNFIIAMFTALGKIFDHLHERQMVNVGRTEEKMAELSKQVNQAHQALKARIALEQSINDKPSSLLDNDSFKRPD